MVDQVMNASRRLREAGVKFELAFEWPRGADGWREPTVVNMLNVTGMKHCCDFDGCAYGLVDSRGLPVQKPWRVVTTTQRL
eukprot:2548280-Heterocapsa_arctica.AAC.1